MFGLIGRKRRTRILEELRPVVVMGRGHSGTRVIANICTHLRVRMDTAADHQTADPGDTRFTRRIKRIAERNLGVTELAAIRERDLTYFQRAVYSYYCQLGISRSERWGWKFPETYLIGPYVARSFPQARYIHLIRDGRDIAFKKHLTDNPRRRLGYKILEAINALDFPHHVQAGLSWAYQLQCFESFCKQLSDDLVLEIRFEDLCRRPFESTERITSFLDLPLTHDCEHYLRESLNPKKIAQYRNEDRSLLADVERSINGELARYGYR